MTETYIDYDAKVQDALRGVVKSILADTARDGLKGDHHFYVAFKTQAEGVNIPPQLVSRFPDEMTIVLQHKFWGLTVHDDRFEIGLSFNQKPEHLEIPFAAIVGFVDPSVQFALQFHDEPGEESIDDGADLEQEGDDALLFRDDASNGPQDASDLSRVANTANNERAAKADDGNNVVTLDAFRKK